MHNILSAVALTLLSSIGAQDAPDLRIFVGKITDRIGPGETRSIAFTVDPTAVAHDVRVAIEVTGGATIAGITAPAGFTCNGTVCTAATFGPQAGVIRVTFVAPDRNDGGTIGVDAVISSNDQDANPSNNHVAAAMAMWAQYFVDNADDSGPGSLRQALRDSASTAFTYPTRIVFRVPNPSTIHPRSPLPPLGGILTIDATGKGIELRGDLQQEGDGINLESICEARVHGLTITGFPRNGVNIGHSLTCGGVEYPPVIINDNAIGFNERGIGGGEIGTVWVGGNEIGNNRRSGIFLGGGVADIRDNVIGVTRDGAFAPNGASGIYVNLFSANIEKNVIANNQHFGIAVSALSPSIHMRENLIYANGQTAIDYGLDLETPNGDDGGGTDVRRPMLNHPVLIDAHYDAVTNKTMVRGHYESKRATTDVVIEFFASPSLSVTGHAEARQFLGKLKIFSQHDYEFAFDGDLTSQWIAATATFEDSLSIVRDATSELSGPIRVSP
jgi:hypothetical protein